MRSKFQFSTSISSILCKSETEWVIQFLGEDNPAPEECFSFVIMCTGLLSTKPNIPRLPGSEDFLSSGGMILHSSEWRSHEIFEGKRVIVVGNGKSAADAATAAAEVAKAQSGTPPIQVARRQMWYVLKRRFQDRSTVPVRQRQ
jgi:cation diffusion facilitator CzcD-associated flavoprotein CzcO